MDRNTFWGLFLILAILVGSTYLMKPSEEEIKREKQVQDSIAQTKSVKPATQNCYRCRKLCKKYHPGNRYHHCQRTIWQSTFR